MEERTNILNVLLKLGAAMLLNGAEVNRVERRLEELGRAYGASEMSVFVITACMVVTMEFPDGSKLTQTRRADRMIERITNGVCAVVQVLHRVGLQKTDQVFLGKLNNLRAAAISKF